MFPLKNLARKGLIHVSKMGHWGNPVSAPEEPTYWGRSNIWHFLHDLDNIFIYVNESHFILI